MDKDNISRQDFKVVILKIIKELGRRINSQIGKLEIFIPKLEIIKNSPPVEIKDIINNEKYTVRNQQ